MARAQKSYMVGSTSPSSFIQTAFLEALSSVFNESLARDVSESLVLGMDACCLGVVELAVDSVVTTNKRKIIFDRYFMLLMYKVLA